MKETYDWVPWIRELAGKIAEGGKADLIRKARQVKWGGEDPALLRYGDDGIDPFSFFYFLASKNTRKQRKPVYGSVRDVFEIQSRLPTGIDDCYIFPLPKFKMLFHDGKVFHSDLLWRLLRQVVKDAPTVDEEDFQRVLEIKNVGVAKLTQTLFLINPEYYLPIDDTTKLIPALQSDIKDRIRDGGYGEYRRALDKLKGAFPGCQPYEINMFLWIQQSRRKGINADSKFFQVSTNAHGPSEGDHWEKFKKNNHVYTGGPQSGKSWGESPDEGKRRYPLTEPEQGDIILVRTGISKGRAIGMVYKNDYAELGLNENSRIHVLWINKLEEEFSGGRTTEQFGFNEAELDSKTYLAFKKTEGYTPTFDLIKHLKGLSENNPEPDPAEQESKADTMKHPLNQILYGPPGTGKTWNVVDFALAIIEGKSLNELEEENREDKKRRFDELKKSRRIAMVTFHQNFTYEDFIEGIRPVLDDEKGNIEYELSKGLFWEIANLSDENRRKSGQTGDESWETDELLQAYAASIEERLESGQKINLFPPDDRSGATIGEVFWSGDGKFKSIQLAGTVKHQRLTKNVIKRDYSPFCRGEIKSARDIKPTYKSKRIQHGNAMYYFALLEAIKQFHDKEWQPQEPQSVEKQNYVLIIDEINRGNIAKIFGELITLIEPSKRLGQKDETTVALPYSKDNFGVPDNVYIIGTMNTADRSIALLDTALRRRFEFIEMMPDSYHDLISTDIEGVNCRRLLAAMNERIRFLLDREHQIGHTYFIDVDNVNNIDFLSKGFKTKIIPLLQEYFYDNWEKIDLVLNKNGFVHTIQIPEDLRKSDLVDNNRDVYELLPFHDNKWRDPQSYQKIYGENKPGETDETAQDT